MAFLTQFKLLLQRYCDGKYAVFCRETGIPKTTVSGWLNCGQLPRVEQVCIICRYYGVSADWLLGVEQERQDRSDAKSEDAEA